MQNQGKIKRDLQEAHDLALAYAIHAATFIDAENRTHIRDELHGIAQTLIDEFYPELTHLRLEIDGQREWLAEAKPEGVA